MAESSDEELAKAMQPAIIIESNLPMEEMQKFIDGYDYAFNRNFRRAVSKEVLKLIRK